MFTHEDLNPEIRALMLEEEKLDETQALDQYAPRLTGLGRMKWRSLLRAAVERGDAGSLASALRAPGLLKTHESRHDGRVATLVAVPRNAADVLAQWAFNRLYMRAVCRSAIDRGLHFVVVYRARASVRPRAESDALVGKLIDARYLLAQLRRHPDEKREIDFPLRNSGLSVRLPIDLILRPDQLRLRK